MLNSALLRDPACHPGLGIESIDPAEPVRFRALRSDPDSLWNSLCAFNHLIVQVRHRYARLVARLPLPARDLDTTDEGALRTHPDFWTHTLVRTCPRCACQCPPSIRMHDAAGGEFLQLCSGQTSDHPHWRAMLRRHFSAAQHRPNPRPGLDEDGCTRLPTLPSGNATRLPSERLPGFLCHISSRGDLVRLALATPGARLAENVRLERLFASGQLLHLGEPGFTLQLFLPALTGIVIEQSPSAPLRVHLAGPGDTSLACLSPAGGRPAVARWRDHLARLHD